MNWLVVEKFSLFLFVITLQCAFSTVIEVDKQKDLKKTIATKTNLFVLYTNSKTPEVTNVKNVLKSVDGNVAFVDCNSKDMKKSCKKALPDGEAYVLKHYKDGQFNKDYDRQMTKSSLQNFLKDPTGDFPFDEEPVAKDVVHINSISVCKHSVFIACAFYVLSPSYYHIHYLFPLFFFPLLASRETHAQIARLPYALLYKLVWIL